MALPSMVNQLWNACAQRVHLVFYHLQIIRSHLNALNQRSHLFLTCKALVTLH